MYSYYKDPDLYWRHLDSAGLLDKMYEAMLQDDLANLALSALEVLKKSDTVPKFDKQYKTDARSNVLREEGNKAYMAGNYRTALEYYNKALLYAYDNTKAMKLAYSNRSALLFKIKNYDACLRDIETCFAMGSSKEITEKLKKRKEECEKLIGRETSQYAEFTDDYFKLNGPAHHQVSCVSTDVEITNDDIPKIVAAEDLRVGTIIGIETAYSALLNPINQYISCFYCHRMSLNLKPCKNCCFALFCNNKCRDKCMEETHNVECRLMDMIHGLCYGPYSRITFHTVLKIKQSCTWDKFITASYEVGEERLKKSTACRAFNSNHIFSILCYTEQREIKTGSKYNFAFMAATFLLNLMNVPYFFPYAVEERDNAIRGLARMTMKLLLTFYNKLELNNVADDRLTQELKHMVPNYGYFSFTSKLKHACDANLLPIALNNKVALIVLQPIRKGKELTISYVDHAYDQMHEPEMSQKDRIVQLYRFAIYCRCGPCTGSWKLKPKKLNKDQRKYFEKWIHIAAETIHNGPKAFDATCRGLEIFNGMGHTKEHHLMYGKLRSLMCVYQVLASKNYAPSDNDKC